MDDLPWWSPDGIFVCPPSAKERCLTEAPDAKDLMDLVQAGELPSLSDKQTLPYFIKKHSMRLQRLLRTAPAFVNALRAMLPEEMLAAVLTDPQKAELAAGTLKLLTKKDGSILATLCKPDTGSFVANVPLEHMRLTPELASAVAQLSTQIQMVQIMEKLDQLQQSVDQVLRGQQDDRLATADSCIQKYREALMIRDPSRRQDVLLHIARDAEDSRNLLMRNMYTVLSYVLHQPEDSLGKLLGDSYLKVNEKIEELRICISAINKVSAVEALAYQHLYEPDAMLESLKYYGTFLSDALFSDPKTQSRLKSMDASDDGYWNKTIPELKHTLDQIAPPETYLQLEGEPYGNL